MSKVFVIGNDPSLRERIETPLRHHRIPGDGVRVEFLEFTEIASLARRRPQAVVMDIRTPSAATIEVIALLKARAHQPSLMLQVTPRQMLDGAWTQMLPASRTVLFTTRTSRKEVQGILQSLLGPINPAPAVHTASDAVLPSKDRWRKRNDRRIDLIVKERDHRLTKPEQVELSGLQKQAKRQMNRNRTLDFDALANFEAEAQEIVGRG